MYVHVCQGYSGAGGLKLALQSLGRDERVLPMWDDLCLGPLDATRSEWLAETFPEYDGDEASAADAAGWRDATTGNASPRIWFHRRCANEYLRLLELATRVADPEILDVVDVSAIDSTLSSFSATPTKALAAIVESSVTMRLAEPMLADLRTLWPRLVAENAPLRVMTPAGVASAPVTHFDDALVAQAELEWTNPQTVVGNLYGVGVPELAGVPDWFLFDRVYTLVDEGRLEQADSSDNHHRFVVRRAR